MSKFRIVLVVILVVFCMTFAVQNAEQLQVNFLFWSVSTRRVIVLGCVLLTGVIIGWVLRSITKPGA